MWEQLQLLTAGSVVSDINTKHTHALTTHNRKVLKAISCRYSVNIEPTELENPPEKLTRVWTLPYG